MQNKLISGILDFDCYVTVLWLSMINMDISVSCAVKVLETENVHLSVCSEKL